MRSTFVQQHGCRESASKGSLTSLGGSMLGCGRRGVVIIILMVAFLGSEYGWAQQGQSGDGEGRPGPVQSIELYEAPQPGGSGFLERLRDRGDGWLTGNYVRRDQELVALTSPQRQEIYLQQTWASPGAYLKRMFAAGIDQARGAPREWGGGWKGYAARFASRQGQFAVANSLAAFGNARLGLEPRYDQCRCSGFWDRTRHAVARNFYTYNRSEWARRPQWALYGGALGGGLISTAWKPHPRNAFAEGGRAVLGQAAYGALLNFVTEFAVDINHKLGGRR
jgi:hypothetical protein